MVTPQARSRAGQLLTIASAVILGCLCACSAPEPSRAELIRLFPRLRARLDCSVEWAIEDQHIRDIRDSLLAAGETLKVNRAIERNQMHCAPLRDSLGISSIWDRGGGSSYVSGSGVELFIPAWWPDGWNKQAEKGYYYSSGGSPGADRMSTSSGGQSLPVTYEHLDGGWYLYRAGRSRR
jgi:hypothetical protein